MNRRTWQMDGEPGAANPVGAQPDLAGYPDVDRLTKGYREASTEAQRQKARADALELAMNQMGQRQQIDPRGHARAEDRLAELGIPVDAMDELVTRRANEIVSKAFEPIAKGMTARTTVAGEYPDYIKYESDVANYINSDARLQKEYNEMFQTNPEAAMKYAFLSFGEQQRKTATPPAEKKSNRVDAQIPSSRSTESRSRPDDGSDNLQKAFQAYQQTGDPRARDAYVKTRLKGIFSDGFFDK